MPSSLADWIRKRSCFNAEPDSFDAVVRHSASSQHQPSDISASLHSQPPDISDALGSHRSLTSRCSVASLPSIGSPHRVDSIQETLRLETSKSSVAEDNCLPSNMPQTRSMLKNMLVSPTQINPIKPAEKLQEEIGQFEPICNELEECAIALSFLGLPLELRRKIYRNLHVTKAVHDHDGRDRSLFPTFGFCTQVLQVCHQIYDEASEVMYAESSINLFIRFHYMAKSVHLGTRLPSLSNSKLCFVRTLTIQVHRCYYVVEGCYGRGYMIESTDTSPSAIMTKFPNLMNLEMCLYSTAPSCHVVSAYHQAYIMDCIKTLVAQPKLVRCVLEIEEAWSQELDADLQALLRLSEYDWTRTDEFAESLALRMRDVKRIKYERRGKTKRIALDA